MVFFGHLVLAVFPGVVSFAPGEVHFPAELTWGVSPLSWLWKGSFAVCIFFVLSGYVLAGFCRKTRLSVPAQIVRRYLRLSVPMLVTSAFAWAIFAAGLMRNVEAAQLVSHSEWLAMWYRGFEPSFIGMAREALFDAFRNGRSDYNCNLWTMRIELIGSVGIFLGFALLRNRVLRILVTCGIAAATYDSYYSLFAVGVLFEELESEIGAFLESVIASDLIRQGLVSLVAVAGLYLGAYSHTPAGMVPTWHFFFPRSLPTTAYHMAGAVLLVGALLYCRWLQRALSGGAGRFLGRLSFVLYLIHIPVICSVTAWSLLTFSHWPYGVNAAIAVAVTTVAVFGGSTLLYRFVDVYTTSLSRAAGRSFDRIFPLLAFGASAVSPRSPSHQKAFQDADAPEKGSARVTHRRESDAAEMS